MNSVVCTLFEGDYHYGVAALTNSLYRNGFRGSIYAGFRGDLVNWCSESKEDSSIGWPQARTLVIREDLKIHFLPVSVNSHLAHFKPEFMIQLVNGPANNYDSITYFDPDIVIKCPWSFFEKWSAFGVSIVHEVVMNDMPLTHPTRMEWECIIRKAGGSIEHNITSYLNCGFCGVAKQYFEFIQLWADMVNLAINVYKQDPNQFSTHDRTSPFWSIDQDTFNMSAMSCNVPISEMGPEAMDFINGGRTMSHATGSPKPWRKNILLSTFKGVPPSLSDKSYFDNVTGVLNLFSETYVRSKKISIIISSFISRFYKKT